MQAWREDLSAGDSYFGAQLDSLDDVQLQQECRLPGWTRAHLVTHVTRNADGLVNLLEWARTGIETPMYPSSSQREADIDAGALRPPALIRAAHLDAAQRLSRAIDGLPAGSWSARVRTASGRTIAASEVVWIRVREIWVHAVDLGAGGRFEDVPAQVGDGLLDEALTFVGSKKDCPQLRVVCRESGQEWTLGDPSRAGRPVVEGSRPDLLRWALGRPGDAISQSAEDSWPQLPNWL